MTAFTRRLRRAGPGPGGGGQCADPRAAAGPGPLFMHGHTAVHTVSRSLFMHGPAVGEEPRECPALGHGGLQRGPARALLMPTDPLRKRSRASACGREEEPHKCPARSPRAAARPRARPCRSPTAPGQCRRVGKRIRPGPARPATHALSLAAGRAGVRVVLIPKENEKDLAEVPAEIKAGLTIHPVAHMDEVLGFALLGADPLAACALLGEAAPAGIDNCVAPH